MIISIEKLRELVPSSLDENHELVKMRLEAIERFIRGYTRNNFQQRNVRAIGKINDRGELDFDSTGFKTGDTFQITKSLYNDGLYVYGDNTVYEPEPEVLVTKVAYPPDIVMGAVNLYKWESASRDKTGISSETLSRYSVSYADPNGDNSSGGYPKGLVGFLKPYMKAQF